MTTPITEFSHFDDLRIGAARNDPAVLREVAGQFEALFLQTMLKNMREASIGEPLLGNSDQYEMYQDMMDQQLSVEMASGKGIGLAEMLVRQLGGETSFAETARTFSAPVRRSSRPAWATPEAFAEDIWPHAKSAAETIGVAPEAIVAQAALETGWGARVMQNRKGENSFNLFGIKAGSNWRGDNVEHRTLEFEGGAMKPQRERFRAYGDVAAAFADYARLIGESPRYESVRGQGSDSSGFAQALQDSGYATDPDYASKIKDILDSPTMRRVMSGLRNGGDNA